MVRVRTVSGTVYEFTGPDAYRRNGREHRCLVWGAVVPAGPRGGLMFMVPVQKSGSGIDVVPVRILPGKVAEGKPIAFLLPDGDDLRAVLSTPVVAIEGGAQNQSKGQGEQGPEGKIGPLPADLLKKLMGG